MDNNPQHETARVSSVPATSMPLDHDVPVPGPNATLGEFAHYFTHNLQLQGQYLRVSVEDIKSTIDAQAIKFQKALDDSQKMGFWDYTWEGGKILITAGVAALFVSSIVGRNSGTDELVT